MNSSKLYSYLAEHNFFSLVWGKSIVHKFRCDEIFKKDLITSEEIFHLLSLTHLDPSIFLLYKNGAQCSPDFLYDNSMIHFPNGKYEKSLSFNQIMAKIQKEKYSLKIFGIEKFSPHLFKFLQDVAMSFKHQISLNAYFTPKEQSVCFLPHTDNYNIFIFQVKGKKRWFYDDVITDLQPHHPLRTEDVKKEVILEEGDIFYLPAMTPHYAQTLEEDSFHLTLGFHPITLWHFLSYLNKNRNKFSENIYDVTKAQFNFSPAQLNLLLEEEQFYDFIASSLYSSFIPQSFENKNDSQLLEHKIYIIPDACNIQMLKENGTLMVWLMSHKFSFQFHVEVLETLFNKRTFDLQEMEDLGIPPMFSLTLMSKLKPFIVPFGLY